MIFVALICVWRLFLFIVACISQIHYIFTPSFPYADIYLIPSKLPQWVWVFGGFDGVHYLGIARFGYFAQYTQAFFPLYPLLIRLISLIFHDQYGIISAQSLSLICLIGATYFLKKLLSLEYRMLEINWIIFFLLIFPTSFYFAAIYTESFFLFLLVLSFWFARLNKWKTSAFFALLASATRVTGIFLILALIVEQQDSEITNIFSKKFTSQRAKKILFVLKDITISPYLWISLLGILGYMGYLQFVFHDALYFWHAQSAFGAARQTSIVLLPQVLWRYAKILTSVSFSSEAFLIAAFEILAFILTFVCLVYGHIKKIRFSYLVFSWLVLLVPTLTGTLTSIPRYILLCFPIYIVLGTMQRKQVKILMSFILLFLLIFMTLRFTSGRWVA
jgi:hypothetical protein